MKSSIMLAIFFCVFSLLFLKAHTASLMSEEDDTIASLLSEDETEEASSHVRSKRAACWGGELGCAAYCASQGKWKGGCCGKQYTNCHNTCYCNGSGYEYRCYRCDL